MQSTLVIRKADCCIEKGGLRFGQVKCEDDAEWMKRLRY